MLAPLALVPWKSFLLKGLSSVFAAAAVDKIGKVVTRDNARDALKTYSALRGQSIGQSAALGIISPMVLIEDSLTHQPYMTDLMTVINMRDIRDALSHLAYQGQVGGINITKLIAEVNPNAAAAGFLSYSDPAESENMSASELCVAGCESFGEMCGMEAQPSTAAFRQYAQHRQQRQQQQQSQRQRQVQQPQQQPQPTQTGTAIRAQDDLSVYSPLAVGRTVVASVKSGREEGHFPLTFKQIPVPVDKTSLELLFSAVKGGAGFTARVKDRQAGAITYPELIGGADDIRNEFRIRNNDLSGFYQEASKRGATNLAAALVTGNISLNTQANTIIISKETADQIELQNGFRFNGSSMSKVRSALKANTIVIVNDARGIFEFLTPVSALSEKYTEAQIKLKSAKEDSASSLESLVKLLNGR